MGRLALALALACSVVLQAQDPPSRLEQIRARGTVGCGIEPGVPGFSDVDASGRHHGLDIDLCRAIAAAVLGSPDRATFTQVRTLPEFRRAPAVDVVVRRLTWELKREEPLGLLFGPVTFYDGQSFLVPARLGLTSARALRSRRICVAGGTVFEVHANEWLGGAYEKVVFDSPHAYEAIAAALASGQCDAHTGDVSDLAVIRSLLPSPEAYRILPDLISEEPLAPLVRDDDIQWFNIVRWTVFALINAEALGVTSATVDAMRRAEAPLEVKRLLGVIEGNGRALGLAESWAADAIRAVGNYGEIYERNLGSLSRIRLDRGRNRLWKDGGLLYAPPTR